MSTVGAHILHGLLAVLGTSRTGVGRAVGAVVAMVVLVAGCGGSSDTEAEPTDKQSSSSSTSTSATKRVGTLETKSGGSIHYTCAGEGSPAILLEAGSDSAGTEQYSSSLIAPLAERTSVCTYDRPGTGLSTDLPNHPRNLDDLCKVQDEVIEALPLTTPYVLLGQSSGGNVVIGCAQRHPDRLAGLVVVEGYHDDPQEMRKWAREEGWTWRGNPEHLDYIDMVDELDGLQMPLGDFPVLILTATDADEGNVKNQRHWLGISSDSRQVVVEGGHDLHDDNPARVAVETLALIGSQLPE